MQIDTKTERILYSIYFYMKYTNNFENFLNAPSLNIKNIY